MLEIVEHVPILCQQIVNCRVLFAESVLTKRHSPLCSAVNQDSQFVEDLASFWILMGKVDNYAFSIGYPKQA